MREELPFRNVPTRREGDLALPEGLEAGLLGGLAVAAVFLVGDLGSGDWLRTPRLLGEAILGTASDPADASSGYAALFHGIHFGIWTLLGFASAWLVTLAERRGLRLRLAFLGAAVLLALVTGAVDHWLAEDLPIGTPLWLGSLAGAVALLGLLAVRHPAVVRRRRGAV